MVSMTVREALNSAMAEEMRADNDVFIMGEEVAEYQGAYKNHSGLAGRVRPQAGCRYTDYRTRFRRAWCRCCNGRSSSLSLNS